MQIGISDIGSFQPIIMADGSNIRKVITIPFRTPLIFRFVFAIKNPETTQREKADKLASQVNFCSIIGITSITPVIIPSNIPNFTRFMFQLYTKI